MKPKPLVEYFRKIKKTFAKFKFKNSVKLLAEPGRAIVSDSFSLVVRVELRKGSFLFINDGKFGNLFAAAEPGFSFPVKLLKKINQINLCRLVSMDQHVTRVIS